MRATKETEILPYRGAPLSAFVKLNAAARATCPGATDATASLAFWFRRAAHTLLLAPARAAHSLARNRSAPIVVPCSNHLRTKELNMGRYLLLWMLGIPLPILALIWVFGGLH